MTPTAARLVFAAAAYLIGAFPTGYLAVRMRARRDIRTLGSGATGATNVLRVSGWKTAVPVAAIDIFKGAIPAWLAMRLFGDPAFAALAAFLAVLGHCFPVYIGFRGGKGVAAAAGAMAALAPFAAAACLGVFLAALAAARYVSLGSILAAIAFPGFAFLFRPERPTAAWSLPIVLLILLRHAGNIGRLLAGTEPKLGTGTGVTR
jgi:acyl phosphate:glycerol-3-phosphate acyltransferase